MVNIILSTGNITGATAGSIGRTSESRSNLELTNSLRLNIDDAISSISHDEANDHTTSSTSPSWKRWTSLENNGTDLFVPSIDFTNSALSEERSSYDITLKLFYLPSCTPASRHAATQRALSLVLQELHIPDVDLLIASFPGIYFDEETESCPDKIKSRGPPPTTDPEPLSTQLSTWDSVLAPLQTSGQVQRLGVAEFGAERLRPLLEQARIPPAVDQINLRDCCSVPAGLLALAKQRGVELLVHNDCTDVLPRGTLRDILGPKGAGLLVGEGGRGGDGRTDGLKGEVTPLWVVKYTAVVRDRGVVENKGYFAFAELSS